MNGCYGDLGPLMQVMVIGLGAIVGFIVYAMFMPMITILSVLIADVYP